MALLSNQTIWIWWSKLSSEHPLVPFLLPKSWLKIQSRKPLRLPSVVSGCPKPMALGRRLFWFVDSESYNLYKIGDWWLPSFFTGSVTLQTYSDVLGFILPSATCFLPKRQLVRNSLMQCKSLGIHWMLHIFATSQLALMPGENIWKLIQQLP